MQMDLDLPEFSESGKGGGEEYDKKNVGQDQSQQICKQGFVAFGLHRIG